MIYLRYNFRKGFLGYTPKEITKMAQSGRIVGIYEGGVYDLTTYVQNNGQAPFSVCVRTQFSDCPL